MSKINRLGWGFLVWLCMASAWPVHAQQTPVWVQVEAQPTLSAAQDRVRAYDAQFENVAGYYLGGGWYGIVLGPYTPTDAETLLRQLRGAGQIPRDSFIANGSGFRQQFWPVGIAAETSAQPLPGAAPAPAQGAVIASETPLVEVPRITTPDETPREARASEALLDRSERELLQTALKWAGFYDAAIDGAFGRGTRSAMEAWQAANNHEATGVLTSAQRTELIGAYNAVLDGMDLALVRDEAAGIEILMPTGVVAFDSYEPPFARYAATGDLDAQVLLISQPGDQNRLFGLYEILQTLAVIPTDGPRERGSTSFTLEGADSRYHSYVQAELRNDRIKGFALIWPAGDDERRRRVLDEMIASYARVSGVLDPAIAPPDEDQAIDLVAGLEVRKPRISRSGFFIDRRGTVLTTSEAVAGCERLTIDTEHDASVQLIDEDLGVAVLRPVADLAPMGVAAFQIAVPRIQSEIAVAGYPYGGVLVTPSLTFGKLADIRGLDGEDDRKRLALTAQPGDAGGPVFDTGGAVLGMLLPREARNGQILPPEVSFSVDADRIAGVLAQAGITVETTDSAAFMPPEMLTLRAADQTVLVSCW